MALARPVDLDALREAAEQARPVALAGEQLLPVLDPLRPLLPEGGLRRGTTVTVEGAPGATSLALALGAAASAAGSWAAAVGLPALGWLAAAELGVALERVVVVSPPPAAWATVVAALLDAVDLVWAGLPPRLSAGDARRLVARARERGSVLVPLARPATDGSSAGWPSPAPVRLAVASPAWTGPAGAGAGRLLARRVEVVATGRGAAARERRVALWLPGPDGGVAPASHPGDTPPGDPPLVLCRLDHCSGGRSDKEGDGVGGCRR
ncbi:MAG TPA: hypothetical protein VGV63_03245 [Acidimicrobiales bacterium]|nr:hypothetical protein [Acidimicrobiales bacterium]